VVGEVVKTKQPFSKSAYYEWSDRQKQFDHLGLTAVIGVPVTCGENLLGVLALYQNEDGSEFSADQMDILLSFGKHAGAALEKAQMLEEQIKTGNLIEALVSELDDERLMDKILELLGDHYPDAYCEILEKNEKANELRVVASNFPATFDRTKPIKLSKSRGITAWVASTGKTKIIRDVRDEKLYIPALPETRSEIAVALPAGTKVMGVLNVESRKVAAFTERDERVLTRLATAIGAQVNREHRIDQAKRQMEQSQTLSEFRSQVIGAPELNDKLEIVSKKLLEISEADLSVVVLLTRDGRQLRVRAAHADDPHNKWDPGIGKLCSLLTIPHLAEEVMGASHKVYKTSEPFGDRLLQSLSDHISLEQKLQSVLLIPLKEGATFAGLCILGSMGFDREVFTDQQIGAAVTIAERAAPLIQQARTLELERGRGQVLKHLTRVGNTVTATLDQKKVFNLIDEYCLKLLNAEISTTFLVRRPGFLSLVSNSGSPPGGALIGLELEIKEGDGLTGHIAKEGEIFNKHGKELHEHPAIKSKGPHPHLPSGYCSSILAVPFKEIG
jgi:GAF domain-containing protein